MKLSDRFAVLYLIVGIPGLIVPLQNMYMASELLAFAVRPVLPVVYLLLAWSVWRVWCLLTEYPDVRTYNRG